MNNRTGSELANLALRAVALAMAVVVVVLGVLRTATADTQITLLAIGLLALAITSFGREDEA